MSLCFGPHTIITHPYPRHKFCFIKSTSTISPITAKILYIQTQNESSLLMRICFSPHTIITHHYQKHKIPSLSPHQPSHCRLFTTKIMYIQKHVQWKTKWHYSPHLLIKICYSCQHHHHSSLPKIKNMLHFPYPPSRPRQSIELTLSYLPPLCPYRQPIS